MTCACISVVMSFIWDSKRLKTKAHSSSATMMPLVPTLSRKVRPLRSTRNKATMVNSTLTTVMPNPALAASASPRPACDMMITTYCSSELMPVAWLSARIEQARMNGMMKRRWKSDPSEAPALGAP